MAEWFEPYVVCVDIGGGERRFLIGTPQAKDWYDPLPAHYREELRWLRGHVDFGVGRLFVDVGCHHGMYLATLPAGCAVIGVDLHGPNLALAEANAAINRVEARLFHCAILDAEGWVTYNGYPLGAVVNDGPVRAPATTLMRLAPGANVVKMDIEGAEYQVLPGAVREMEKVDTWIVEFHPWYELDGKSTEQTLVDGIGVLAGGEYECWWLDRTEAAPGFRRLEEVGRLGHGTLAAFRVSRKGAKE